MKLDIKGASKFLDFQDGDGEDQVDNLLLMFLRNVAEHQ